jgi:hypothetical protein
MRELSTDRPDLTESPFTLDAGHAQLEMDLVNLSRDRQGGIEREGVGVAALNVKLGLTARADLQLLLDAWRRETIEIEPRTRSEAKGAGDLTARLKVNLIGNDGGRWAIAVMPAVTFPTSANGLGGDEVGAGVAVPLALDLGGRGGAGFMIEASTQDGVHAWLSTATYARDIAGPLAGFVELTFGGEGGDAPAATLATFDSGLTFAVTPDVQLDAGIVLGLTRDTEDARGFVGLTVRR